MGRRNRKTLSGRDDRNAGRGRGVTHSVPRLGRRKALWRFVGALALAPLSGAAFGQGMMMPPPGGAPVYAPGPGAYPPVVGGPQAGYAGMGGPGYVTPVGASGPMVAPPPMLQQGGPRVGIPTGSAFTPRLVTSGGYGDGLGWDNGYQSVGGWVPLGLNNDGMVMYLDARGFASFEEAGGGNFTLGYRYYMPGFDRFVGVYGAYDIDAGNADSQTFNRAAFGAESVGKFLTYRVNGYVPLDYEGETVASGQVGDPFFRGNNILFLDRTLTRYQYGGVDAEVGGPLPLIGKYGLSGFLGGYWLTSDRDDAVGFKGRLEANINDDLQIGGKLTTDEIFETNVWATMTVRSPRGSWSNFFRKDWLRQPSVQTQMDRAPEREYRITTDVKTDESETLAINPIDGQPYLVLHVDPTNGIGPGTFENPAGTVAGNNPNFDIVYVSPGTLATNGPIVLFDDQRLLSTAVEHSFDTQRGTFQLPGFTGGPLPILQNTSSFESSVVILADNNEVSGFRILGASGDPDTVHTGIRGSVSGITSFDINRNVFEGVRNGAVITHVGTGEGFFQQNSVSGIGLGSYEGLSVTAFPGDLDLVVAGNLFTGFYGEDANGNSLLDANEDINGDNTLTRGAAVEVVAIGAGGGTSPSNVDVAIVNNVITDNDRGVLLSGNVGSSITGRISGNIINGRGFIPPIDRGLVDFDFTIPTTDFSVPRLGGVGIEAAMTGGQMNLTIGGRAPGLGNVIQNNTGAGIAILASGNAIVTADVLGNEVYSNVDDLTALTPYSGDGLYIQTSNFAQYVNSVIDGNFFGNPNVGQSGNEGSGLQLVATGNSTILNVLVGNEDGNNNNGNVFFNNGFDLQTPFLLNIFDVNTPEDGVFISRSGNAIVDGLRVTDNFISNSADDGVAVFASGSLNDALSLTLQDNIIQLSGDDGVSFFIQSNGTIDGTVLGNTIVSNGQKDIFQQYSVIAGVREYRNQLFPGGIPFLPALFQPNGDYTDLNTSDTGDGVSFEENRFTINGGSVTGFWAGNFIADNFAFGVRSDAPTSNLIFGAADSGNTIVRNGLTGVAIRGAGSARYQNNIIQANGQRLASSGKVPGGDSASAPGGVDIEDRGFKDLTFVANNISFNLGDGVEISNRENFGGFGYTLNFVDNIVASNDGRGFDVLNAGDATMDLTIRGTAAGQSVIAENGREGIYVVNTSSASQSTLGLAPFGPDTDPTHGMDATGPIDEFPFLTLTIDNNDVVGNGEQLSAFGLPSAGVVLRVGTAGGGYGFTNDGGFAGTGRPGVIAVVTNNRMTGNLGADFYTESFTSTVDPPTTGGTWSDTDFSPTGYEGDPLARLDLTFINNVLESVDVNNAGAFYNNAEGTFKSRETGADPEDGPFLDADRRRNAQRVAYRDETLPSTRFPLGQPDNDGGFYDLDPQPVFPGANFLYAGMGESTFRISQSTLVGTNTFVNPDGSTSVFSAAGLFFLDDLPYNDIFDANGVFIIPFQPQDMPYGWSIAQ